jgi:hypothetical protein
VSRVLIVDREAEAGGVPRHSAHTGYGLRDLRRVMTGPAYARHYARAAVSAGAEVRAGATVTGWPGWPGSGGTTGRTGFTDPGGTTSPPGSSGAAGPVGPGGPVGPISVTMTSADGIEAVTASAVLLATGCRERPRAARLVPGGRPPGVMTTGELQQRVYLHGQRLPGRALMARADPSAGPVCVVLR